MKNKLIGYITLVAIIALAGCASAGLVSMEADTVEGPAQIGQGQDINPRDVTVYGEYKDGSRKRINLGPSHIRFNNNAPGTQQVVVRVGGQEVDFQIQVVPLTAIRVTRQPTKNSYEQGQKLDLSGLGVNGSWQGLPDAEIQISADDITGFNTNTVGNQTLTITKHGRTATFSVTVTERIHPLMGTWRSESDGGVYIFTADGTGSFGNYRLTWDDDKILVFVVIIPLQFTYTVSGNTLTMVSTTESKTTIVSTRQ
jgi:hypothetical protein